MLVGLLVFSEALAAPKTDIVILMNGDHITGEIKEFQRGMLRLSTDSMSSVYVEWDDVRGIKSLQYLQIEFQDGSRVFGSFGTTDKLDTLLILSQGQQIPTPVDEVVSITPIEERFWSRFDGSLSFGFSYTKSSDVGQLSFDSDTKYTVEKNQLQLRLSSIVTTQENREPSRNGDVTITYRRLLKHRLFSIGVLSGQHNDELGLDLRLLATLGGGYKIIQSSHFYMMAGTGLSFTTEKNVGVEGFTENLELPVSTTLSWFRYSSPKTDLTLTLQVIPNLTTEGRVRTDTAIKWRHELFKDFFGDLTYYLKTDSDPPSVTAQQNDFAIVFSLSWTY